MTAGGKQALAAPDDPAYVWEEGVDPPPTQILQLWTEVGNGIDKNQTVVWKSAVESLNHANHYLTSSKDARFFVEKYMGPIIGILVEQQPAKIGHHERNCVQESLAIAIIIIAKDLKIQVERKGKSIAVETLSHIFNKKKAFYRGMKATSWNVHSHMQGVPEARMKSIEKFRSEGGFDLLTQYMLQNLNSPFFPGLETVHHVLVAVYDPLVPTRGAPPVTTAAAPNLGATTLKQMEDDAILVANTVIKYVGNANDDLLKKLPTDVLSEIQHDLQKLFDRLITTRRSDTTEFYKFWRALVLKLITSQSLPLKLFGWEQVGDLIYACAQHRPPPSSFVVKDAGCPFVNGTYLYAGPMTEDGYHRSDGEISYVRKIPEREEAGGKTLTLFRCTMRSQQKWWFLSEADEEQPGTDRDIDYYQHKSKEHEESFPPPTGWFTCRSAGKEPPPTLEPKGFVVPEGRELETLDHQLAKWAIENEIVEQVLGDTTIHREVVARSTVLIKFLAGMCDRYPPSTDMTDGPEPTKYCLKSSHLLFAWKTCLRKADAAVSSQVYQLLVSILPLCPVDLAIPLLKAVQTSLHESHQDDRDYLFEVSEFCSALAAGSLVDNKGDKTPVLKDQVRDEILSLLWSVLTHRDASSLKTYDSLKRYVTLELRVGPKGKEHRDKFMRFCIVALGENAKKTTLIDEVQALRMVKLTHFVLDACPRQQADDMVMADSGALPQLIFEELTAYLTRMKNGGSFRRSSTGLSQASSVESDSKQLHLNALNERLRIVRYVYGLSDPRAKAGDPIVMSLSMLETLWQLCYSPEDREALMVFIASASRSGKASQFEPLAPATSVHPASEQLLSAAFTETVCQSVFLRLFCSPSFSYEKLGGNAYKSFHSLFNGIRQSPSPPAEAKKIALDALWRICLTVEGDAVATQAMKDLLSVYVALSSASGKENRDAPVDEGMVTDEKDESFVKRMFQCLARAKDDLEGEAPSAIRSAERCLRILNAAIGRNHSESFALTSSSLIRLSLLGQDADLEAVFKCVPHGMRGQASYRRVTVLAKRPTSQPQGLDNPTRLPGCLKFPLDLHPLETLASLKRKVAEACECPLNFVKPLQINGRSQNALIRPTAGENPHISLSVVPEDSVVDELGIVEGCELVFVIAEQPQPQLQTNTALPAPKTQRNAHSNDLSSLFFNEDGKIADSLFNLLFGILSSLPWKDPDAMMDVDDESSPPDTHQLVWDFLLAMPTNASVAAQVKSAQGRRADEPSVASDDDAMEIDSGGETWSQLLDVEKFNRSVYVLLTIDAFLRPAPEVLSILPVGQREILSRKLEEEVSAFRSSFIEGGGFGAVVRFFSASECSEKAKRGKTRRGNAAALRILKSCLFGDAGDTVIENDDASVSPAEAGSRLLSSLSDTDGLLKSLTSMVVDDLGISSATITDVLRFLRLLFQSPRAAQSFISLPDRVAERFLIIPLMRDENAENARTSLSISAALQVRRNAHDLIIQTPVLADSALPWLVKAIDSIDVGSESTSEFFDVLEKLVADDHGTARTRTISEKELRELGTIVCKKLASCPRPASESDLVDFSTSVLCGCLKLLRALIEKGGGAVLRSGTDLLLTETGVARWSVVNGAANNKGVFAMVSSTFSSKSRIEDSELIDLMGAMFDGFLSPGGQSAVAICCDKESRQRGFDVIGAAARCCKGDGGYMALVQRMNGLVSSASPNLRHRWGQFGGRGEPNSRTRVTSKYSGLRNQGCTCYMNSVLQQLFMMPELRRSLCSAPLPASLRSPGKMSAKEGSELVGKKISLQWESGISYDAVVEAFDDTTGMHCIRYCPIQVAVGGSSHHQVDPDEIARLPPQLPDEFVLSEGRPAKETGVFELVKESSDMEDEAVSAEGKSISSPGRKIQETEDEAASRHLLEEVQRTFIHLDEGSRGRCFDPRALVEACACLKLEFDVWQQNDASEFTTKLLDRLEISLKKWAPSHFRHMDHTFGLKQTKQKICKECGLKTNREEKFLNLDCQIRGKNDVHEALASLTEVEIMEGSNKVFCDSCKEKTDTILRTAISTLPNMLILSLKRFDLDYNTFETVKLNSRCAFPQTLNMKEYTLEGLEAKEKSTHGEKTGGAIPMDTEDECQQNEESDDPLRSIPDEDYEYRLAGVLVHAGVAQGGHYYSFIKDRNPGSEEKWYRFDDEDVTPFDPASIESECFGGRVKKETKWNGQPHMIEQEQFANALMLFYEKVKPSDLPPEDEKNKKSEAGKRKESTTTGYDVFEADVRRSNATHRWQSFLFDAELQTFMKGLLGICRVPNVKEAQSASDGLALSWREDVLQMLMSFLLDVMFYSSDRSFIGDWTTMMEEALLMDPRSAQSFVWKLSRKSKEVSSNWLRTYLLDCPDQASRAASVRIFCAAIRSSASPEEIQVLKEWSRAWKEVLKDPTNSSKIAPFPCTLEGKWSALEDVDKLGSGASSFGIIISFLNVLMEAMPRCWRFSSELCLFVRQLATMPVGNNEFVLRRPMTEALIPCRLLALAVRDRLQPGYFRYAFPGSSLPAEVANTQIRSESHPVSHAMPVSGNQAMHASELNAPRGPVASDYATLLEALACLACLPGAAHVSLVQDTGEIARGRHRYALSEAAVVALSTVFQECCAAGAPGMGQREIEIYLENCCYDTSHATPQKITELLNKYPTTCQQGTTYLVLDGFLAYYRDLIQSNDVRLRLDLHYYGFRPDLSRRSRDSRFSRHGERESLYRPAESISLDVAEVFQDRPVSFDALADTALLRTYQLYAIAFGVSEPLALYLVAGAAYMKDCGGLIDTTLQAIYSSPSDWAGSDTVSNATMALQVLATLPGTDQTARITRIMESSAPVSRNPDQGAGLLHVLRSLQQARPTHRYQPDFHWSFQRYIGIVKSLRRSHVVFNWMLKNPSSWNFVQQEVFENRPLQAHQMRTAYGARDGGVTMAIDHHNHSDSDIGGMNDSEDDDDSQFEISDNIEPTTNDGPFQVEVQHAGNPVVNGIYDQDGYFQNACRYTMEAPWNGKMQRFLIFQCHVSNNTKHWYISIVPHSGNPGTSSDIDFYTAPINNECRHVPPSRGWVKAQYGTDPLPYLEHLTKADDSPADPEGIWNESIEEDENQNSRSRYV